MILSHRVCFAEHFDIWFTIFEALFEKILKFLNQFYFIKRKARGRQAGLTAGQAGPEAGTIPEAAGPRVGPGWLVGRGTTRANRPLGRPRPGLRPGPRRRRAARGGRRRPQIGGARSINSRKRGRGGRPRVFGAGCAECGVTEGQKQHDIDVLIRGRE